DVPVAADAQQLDIDRPFGRDQRVVFVCRSEDVLGNAVRAVYALRVDVDVVRELRANDMRVGLRVPRRQTDILCEQKCLYASERESLLPVPANQLSVDGQR